MKYAADRRRQCWHLISARFFFPGGLRVVLAGWSSNNRYSLLGGLRGTAQMISYEIPMGLSLLTVVLAAGTFSLSEIVEASEHWFIWTNPISFLIYLITAFAETNRAPFDLPEAEQELTGGYHTEYGGLKFAISSWPNMSTSWLSPRSP